MTDIHVHTKYPPCKIISTVVSVHHVCAVRFVNVNDKDILRQFRCRASFKSVLCELFSTKIVIQNM